MTHSPDTFTARTLLENSTWLSSLAHRLVKDEQRADDIMQEAWLALIEKPPRDTDTPRAWLATVARRLANKGFRSEARRLEREQKAARSEATVPSDIVERAEIHQHLVDAVLALSEPYRSTLLEHYFDERSAAEIASRRRQPAATVRSQIARGLELLRDRLDGLHDGDRRAWCFSLLPLAVIGATGVAGTAVEVQEPIPVLQRPSVWLTTAAGVAALIFGWTLLSPNDGARPQQQAKGGSDTTVHAPPADADVDGGGGMAPIDDSDSVVGVVVDAVVAPADSSVSPSLPDAATATVPGAHEAQGVVLDVHGHPVAGIDIYLDQRAGQGDPRATAAAPRPNQRILATTDQDGIFEVRSRKLTSYMYLLAESADYTTLRRGWFQDKPEAEILIVVGQRAALSGTVHNEEGLPLAAAIEVDAPHAQLIDFPESLENTGPMTIATSADSEGNFTLRSYPAFVGANLSIKHAGYKPHWVQIAAIDSDSIDVVLERAERPAKKLVLGVVLLADGSPATAASIHFGNNKTTVDEDGSFEFLPRGMINDATPLVAIIPERAPVILQNFGKTWKQGSAADPLEITAGAEPLAIEGVVLGSNGEPAAGWVVRLADATEISIGHYPATYAEGLASGRHSNLDIYTDVNGSFQIAGLIDRSYRIFAYQEGTLLSIRSEPIAAGTNDAVLQLPDDAVLPPQRGRVVSRRGRPLANARVTPTLTTNSGDTGSVWISGTSVTTDNNGYFSLTDCPRTEVMIAVSGAGIMPTKVELDRSGGVFEIEVPERCRFRVEADHLPNVPDDGQMLAADGTVLNVYRFVAGGNSSSNRMTIVEGRTPILAVSEDARTLVLSRGGKEVARLSIDLNPDVVSDLRP
ncbi:MAG: sigma-70 family RNA polymerase sigma factor [Planctomycetota bacterium]